MKEFNSDQDAELSPSSGLFRVPRMSFEPIIGQHDEIESVTPSSDRVDTAMIGSDEPDDSAAEAADVEPPADTVQPVGDSPETADTYEAYMSFPAPEPQPTAPETISRHLSNLGAEDTTVTQAEADGINGCYDQPHRYYHGPSHEEFVGQPHIPEPMAPQPDAETYDPAAGRLSPAVTREWAESVEAVAGLWHDAVYKHVDASGDQGSGAWTEPVQELIGDVARYERTEIDGKAVYHTHLTEAGMADPATRMVAHIFNVGEDGIIHNQGGNEFDSALAAVKWLESKGVTPQVLVTTAAAIAATVPFKPALAYGPDGQITDGHMGELAGRVKTVELNGYQPDWEDVNNTMLLSVNLANRDIAPFIQPDNLGAVIHNGRGVKMEELPVLREQVTNMEQLADASRRTGSAPLLYEWFGTGTGPLLAANVPHFYIPRDADGTMLDTSAAYPPLPVYEAAAEHAETNSRLSSTFFKAHEIGIVFAAALATSIGEPNAPVPGFVHARLWSETALPTGERFNALNNEEQAVFAELMHGSNQATLDTAVPDRSPIAGMAMGALGADGIETLSGRIQQIYAQARAEGIEHPFSNPGIANGFAREVAQAIGPTNTRTILTELQRVAQHFADDPVRGKPDRALRLSQLDLLDEQPN